MGFHNPHCSASVSRKLKRNSNKRPLNAARRKIHHLKIPRALFDGGNGGFSGDCY